MTGSDFSGVVAKPVNTVTPVITGTVSVGSTLTCSTGTWTGAGPITYSYQWEQGAATISGATSATYLVSSNNIGSTLRCKVTATNSGGGTSTYTVNTGTVPPVVGEATFSGSGTWTCPAGVYSVSVVSIGGTEASSSYGGVGGGGLGFKNNIPVNPGQNYSVLVPAGGDSCFIANTTDNAYPVGKCGRAVGTGGTAPAALHYGDGGGNGGIAPYGATSGGGAGGYTGNGGDGGSAAQNGTAGLGGGGGGGADGANASGWSSGGGGGVGPYGLGASGVGGTWGYGNTAPYGRGGSGGQNGCWTDTTPQFYSGGSYGGGGSYWSGAAKAGIVRIIWPGTTRSFPSTNTGIM